MVAQVFISLMTYVKSFEALGVSTGVVGDRLCACMMWSLNFVHLRTVTTHGIVVLTGKYLSSQKNDIKQVDPRM
jgi:hypothetical protein